MSITKSFHIAKEYSKSQNQKYPNEPSSAMTSNTIDFREPAEVDAYLNDMDVVLTLFNNNNGKSAEQKIHDQTEATTTSVFETISEGGTQSLFSFETNQNLQTSKHKVNQTPAFRVAKILKGEFFNSSMIEQPPEKPFAIPATLESFLRVDQHKQAQIISGSALTSAEFQVKLMDKFRDLITYKIFQFCYPRLAAGIPYDRSFYSKDLQSHLRNFIKSIDLRNFATDFDSPNLVCSDELLEVLIKLSPIRQALNKLSSNPNSDSEVMQQLMKLANELEDKIYKTDFIPTSRPYFANLAYECSSGVVYQKLKAAYALHKELPTAKENEVPLILKKYLAEVLINEIPELYEKARTLVNEFYCSESLTKFALLYAKNIKKFFPETDILLSTMAEIDPATNNVTLKLLNDVVVPKKSATLLPGLVK